MLRDQCWRTLALQARHVSPLQIAFLIKWALIMIKSHPEGSGVFLKAFCFISMDASSLNCHFPRTSLNFHTYRTYLKDLPRFLLAAILALLHQCWANITMLECWPAFFLSLGFELAPVCVYTSCPVFSLRHTASLWNRTLIGTARGTKVPRHAIKEPWCSPVNNN